MCIHNTLYHSTIFKTITDESTGAVKSIGLFGKTLNELKSSFANIKTNGLLNSIFKTSSIDTKAIDAYNKAITEATKNNVSMADKQQIMQTAMEGTNKETARLIGSTKGAEVGLKELKAAQDATTLSAKAGQVALKGLAIAGNMLAMWAIGEAISFIVKGIDNLANSAEHCKERVDKLVGDFESGNNTIQQHSETISKIASRYSELSHGVNELGGNVSLTNEEYAEYQDICNQIADMYPTLVKSYDEQGNAILKLKGNVEGLTQALLDEKKANAAKIIESDEIMENYQNTREHGVFDSIGDYFSNFFDSQDELTADMISEQEKVQKYKDFLQMSYEDIKSLTTKIGNDRETIIQRGLLSKLGIDSDTTKEEFATFRTDLEAEIVTIQSGIDQALSSVKKKAGAYLLYNEDYSSLSENEISVISSLLNNIDEDTANSFGNDDKNIAVYVNKIVNLIHNAKPEVQKAINDWFVLGEDVDISTKISALDAIIKTYEDNGIVVPIYFETQKKELNTLQEQYNDSIEKAKKQETDFDWDSWFKENSINTQEEIDRWNKIAESATNVADARKKYTEGEDADETDNLSGKTFNQIWNSLGTGTDETSKKAAEAKEELLKLAEAGQLTEESFKNSSIADTFEKAGYSISEATNKLNGMVEEVKQLDSMRTGISAITSAYDEKKESKKNTVSSSTLNSLGDTLGVSEWSEKDKKVWEDYKNTAGNSKKSLSQLKDAQDELASSYANSNNFLANLNSQNKNYYISLLKEMGVVNAEEIVTKKLRKEQKNLSIVKKELGFESEDLNDSTVSEISRMYDSETASKAAKNAMFDLTLEKIRNGQVKISTAADCTALLNMAQAAGIALSKLKELSNASIEMNLAERQTKDADSLQDALNSGRKTYVSSSGSVLKASESKLAHLRNMANSNKLKAQKNVDKYAKKHKDDYKLNLELTNGNKSNGSKGNKSNGSSKDKSKSTQVIDWIERKLDRLNTKLDLVKAKYDNLPSSSKSSIALLNAENKNLDDQIKILKKVQSVNDKSYSKYMKKAKKSATYTIGKGKKKKTYKLSKSLKKKIQNGRIKGSYKKLIATYGEPKANAIQKYQDYYDKAQSAKKNSQDAKKSITDTKVEKLTRAQNYYDTLNAMNQAYESTAKGLSKNNYVQEQIEATKLSYAYQIKIAKAQGDYNKAKQLEQEKEKATLDLQRQKVENIKAYYDNQVGILDNDKQDIQNQIDLIEARGDIVSKGYYKNLTSEDNAIIAKREAELKDLKSQLSTTDQGTDNWYALQNDIQSVENEINDHKKSVYENTKAIGELNDKMYEAIYAVSSNLNAELDTISSLKRGETSDSDTGTLTDTGLLQLYAAGLSYSATKGTAAEANARLAEIIKANKSGKVLEGYTSLQAQKDAEAQLAKDAQDQVTSVKSYGDKIIEIIKDAISSVADHLQEIIDARKEALNEEKDLRDYERSILEKTKNVSSLQKQFMAVSGDTSEEGRLKAAQLRKSLDEAQQDLQDTEYDRYISDQQEMLDNMMNQFQDLMEKLQKDEDTLLREGIKAINGQKGVMQQIFNKTAEEYGYPTSTNLTELQTALTTGRITADIINSAKDDSVTSVIKTEAEKIVKAYGDAKSGTGGGTPSTGGGTPSTGGGTPSTGGNNSNGGDGGNYIGDTINTNTGNVIKYRDGKTAWGNEKSTFAGGWKNYLKHWLEANATGKKKAKVKKAEKGKTYKSDLNNKLSKKFGYILSDKNNGLKEIQKFLNITKNDKDWSSNGYVYKELKDLGCFATGGIAKIKPVGEDGIAWVRNGEGFVRPEDVQHIRDLMNVTPDLTKLVASFSNLPNVKPLDKNVTRNVSIDNITFDMPNVTNATDFTDTIKKPEQQKAFAAAIGDAFNGKKLNINRY